MAAVLTPVPTPFRGESCSLFGPSGPSEPPGDDGDAAGRSGLAWSGMEVTLAYGADRVSGPLPWPIGYHALFLDPNLWGLQEPRPDKPQRFGCFNSAVDCHLHTLPYPILQQLDWYTEALRRSEAFQRRCVRPRVEGVVGTAKKSKVWSRTPAGDSRQNAYTQEPLVTGVTASLPMLRPRDAARLVTESYSHAPWNHLNVTYA